MVVALQSADVQGLDPISAIVAALRGVAPPDASAQDATPQDAAQDAPAAAAPSTMNPLAAALSGLMPGAVPDNAGGMVPATNSRVAPDGSFLPASSGAGIAPRARMQLASALDPSIAPQSVSPAFVQAGGAAGVPPASAATAGGTAISVPGYDGAFTRAQANDAEGVPSKAEWDAAASGGPQSAGAGDATTAAYQSLHAEKVTEFERNKALALQAAQAGNTDISASYAKAAAEAYKMANDISLLSIKHNEAAADAYSNVTLPNGQIVPFNKSTGAYGTPYGVPKSAPRPPTPEERQTWELPATGAFSIEPGEAPKGITGAGTTTEASLPQNVIDNLAQRYNAGDTGAITNLGFGATANKAAVLTRAAEMQQQQGMAVTGQMANQAAFGGQKQEARTSGGLGARINTFAEEAAQTAPMAIQASEAVPRTQWVPINAIEQMGQAAASNPALSQFQAANNAFANTYAKAVNPSGVPTDESRRAAFQLLNVAKSPEAYAATVHQLQREMRIVQNAVGTIRAQQGGGTAAPSAPMPVGGSTVINGIHIQRVN